MKDFGLISQKLIALGWNVPALLKEKENFNFVKKGKDMWRLYPFISGYIVTELKNINYVSVGELLAKFHQDLKKINYHPCFFIPHFHDTKFFINGLKKVVKYLEDAKLIAIANEIMEIYGKIENISLKGIQLIHGDPRIENYLFDNQGNAFSIIDFDTFMFGSIFIDIGDLLRSINLVENQTVLKFSESRIKEVLGGYLHKNKNVKKETFIVDALNGMRQITLELCSRFLIDIVEDRYFGWDSNKYNSRSENNIIRALVQWDLFKKIERVNFNNLAQSVKIKMKSDFLD